MFPDIKAIVRSASDHKAFRERLNEIFHTEYPRHDGKVDVTYVWLDIPSFVMSGPIRFQAQVKSEKKGKKKTRVACYEYHVVVTGCRYGKWSDIPGVISQRYVYIYGNVERKEYTPEQ